jgi:LysM repeat protein
MEKRTSAFSRIFAAIALVGAVVVVVVVISSSLGEDSGSSTKGHGTGHAAKKHSPAKTKAATYTVETGDTLTSIAHETGVPVAKILDLNPEVDPQILIAGEKLKLR